MNSIIQKIKEMREKNKNESEKHGNVDKEAFILNLNIFFIFFIIGHTFRFFSMAYIGELLPIASDEARQFINNAFLMLATGVAYLPMWWKIITGGWMSLLQIPSYAVITTTTYSDGTVTKSSDFGEQSRFLGAIMTVIWIVVGYVLAAIATLCIIGYQIFTFITKFDRVKNKISYAVTLAAAILYITIAGPIIASALGPVFDPKHFNPAEITKAAETAEKNLYSGDFSYTMAGSPYQKNKKQTLNNARRAEVSYTKATDITVIQIIPINEKAYLNEVKRGFNKVPPGKYTFTGNVFNNSVNTGGFKISEAGIAELTSILPANLIFKRLIDDRKRLRIISLAYVGIVRHGGNETDYTNRVDIRHPEGTNKKNWMTISLRKIGNEYKLLSFWLEPYRSTGEIVYK